MLGNFLGCITGVKDPSKAQEGRWDISRDAGAEKGLPFRLGLRRREQRGRDVSCK